MNITVIGAGYVGLVAACCLAGSGHRVTCVEKDPARLELLEQGRSPILEKDIDLLLEQGLASGRLTFSGSLPAPLEDDIAMIAVGTPALVTGAADLSFIYQVVAEVRAAAQTGLVLVMKSTVPPGTGARLVQRYLEKTPISYVSNPEFLREGLAVEDWYHPGRIVIGAQTGPAADLVAGLYSGIPAPVIVTDITSAETIKYAANAFLATKISFINEIANLCEAVGATIDDVVAGIGLDPRIGPDFLRAGLGYGGSCFPKDTRALDFVALNHGYDFRLLKSTIEVNTRQRVLPVHKLKHLLGGLEGKEIALLGLAFKPGTDDVREAPALDIARLLHEAGARLRVYDPAAMDNARLLLPEDIVFARDMYEAVAGASALVLVTEWPQFIEADWSAIKLGMSPPHIIFDGRNALSQDKLSALGFKYVGVGRKL
ncbi:MAG: UDP-glucose/GDP-mannose dehydrogenase family protein [Dehalococcoidia bacterium]